MSEEMAANIIGMLAAIMVVAAVPVALMTLSAASLRPGRIYGLIRIMTLVFFGVIGITAFASLLAFSVFWLVDNSAPALVSRISTILSR